MLASGFEYILERENGFWTIKYQIDLGYTPFQFEEELIFAVINEGVFKADVLLFLRTDIDMYKRCREMHIFVSIKNRGRIEVKIASVYFRQMHMSKKSSELTDRLFHKLVVKPWSSFFPIRFPYAVMLFIRIYFYQRKS